MLRSNLSTRPFYNERAAQLALGAAGLLLLGAVVFNVVQVVRLGTNQQALGARASEAEEEVARLRDGAEQILAQINPQELQVVENAAREANDIIDQRAFSWTELFGRFESTLPPDVRITAVQPRLDRAGDFVVAIGVEAQRAEDLDAFVESLEASAGFHDALAVRAQTGVSGLIEAVVEGTYAPSDGVSGPLTADTNARPSDDMNVPPPDNIGVRPPDDMSAPPPAELGAAPPDETSAPPPDGLGVPPPDGTSALPQDDPPVGSVGLPPGLPRGGVR